MNTEHSDINLNDKCPTTGGWLLLQFITGYPFSYPLSLFSVLETEGTLCQRTNLYSIPCVSGTPLELDVLFSFRFLNSPFRDCLCTRFVEELHKGSGNVECVQGH